MTATADRIVRSQWFHRFIILIILLAGVLAGLETNRGIVAAHSPLLRMLDTLVLGIFLIEMMLKMAAHNARPWHYFKDGWNVFDFVIVALCCLPMGSQFAVVLRLGRVLRLLRLMSTLPKLQLLVGALLKSFSSMGYVGLLLGLMFYIYAIMGVQLFGVHDPAHFGSLPSAFLTLFQTITLDDWKFLFASASGSSPVIAAVFFVSFILLGTMIMLNLFIGIIMNSMSEMHAELEGLKQTAQTATDSAEAIDDLDALHQQLAAMKTQLDALRTKLTKSTSDKDGRR